MLHLFPIAKSEDKKKTICTRLSVCIESVCKRLYAIAVRTFLFLAMIPTTQFLWNDVFDFIPTDRDIEIFFPKLISSVMRVEQNFYFEFLHGGCLIFLLPMSFAVECAQRCYPTNDPDRRFQTDS